jgi:hypothetical protein
MSDTLLVKRSNLDMSTLEIVEARGDHYSCGRDYGAATKRNIIWRLNNFVDNEEFEDSSRELHAAHENCKQYFPQYLRELQGIADGAEVDFWKLLYFNFPELSHADSGCTSIAIREANETLLVHNEDSVGEERGQDGFLLHYALPTMSFYAFAYAGELPGTSYGWNSHGAFFTCNDLYLGFGVGLQDRRVSRTFVARQLMEATDIDDAVTKLKSGHSASGYHNFIGKRDRLVSVEQFRDEVSVEEVVGTDVHTNHYLHPRFAAKMESYKHSRMRYDRVNTLLREGYDPLRVLADRADAPYAICTLKNEELHTLSTVRFLPLQHRVEVYEPKTLELQARLKLWAD